MVQTNEKLTEVMLNGKNYHSWVRQITFALIRIDKLKYVTGEMPPPQEIWEKDNHLVANWLLNVMELHITYIMSLHNTSQEIWEKTSKRGTPYNIYHVSSQHITRDLRKDQKKRNYVHIYELKLELQ
jgi:hypothetical protein